MCPGVMVCFLCAGVVLVSLTSGCVRLLHSARSALTGRASVGAVFSGTCSLCNSALTKPSSSCVKTALELIRGEYEIALGFSRRAS